MLTTYGWLHRCSEWSQELGPLSSVPSRNLETSVSGSRGGIPAITRTESADSNFTAPVPIPEANTLLTPRSFNQRGSRPWTCAGAFSTRLVPMVRVAESASTKRNSSEWPKWLESRPPVRGIAIRIRNPLSNLHLDVNYTYERHYGRSKNRKWTRSSKTRSSESPLHGMRCREPAWTSHQILF